VGMLLEGGATIGGASSMVNPWNLPSWCFATTVSIVAPPTSTKESNSLMDLEGWSVASSLTG
jgi:hypothetical protein